MSTYISGNISERGGDRRGRGRERERERERGRGEWRRVPTQEGGKGTEETEEPELDQGVPAGPSTSCTVSPGSPNTEVNQQQAAVPDQGAPAGSGAKGTTGPAAPADDPAPQNTSFNEPDIN